MESLSPGHEANTSASTDSSSERGVSAHVLRCSCAERPSFFLNGDRSSAALSGSPFYRPSADACCQCLPHTSQSPQQDCRHLARRRIQRTSHSLTCTHTASLISCSGSSSSRGLQPWAKQVLLSNESQPRSAANQRRPSLSSSGQLRAPSSAWTSTQRRPSLSSTRHFLGPGSA